MDNGSTAPPGAFVTYLPYVYKVDTLAGPNGNTLLKPDITIVANNVAYQVTTDYPPLSLSLTLVSQLTSSTPHSRRLESPISS